MHTFSSVTVFLAILKGFFYVFDTLASLDRFEALKNRQKKLRIKQKLMLKVSKNFFNFLPYCSTSFEYVTP